jgi:hypothetical protein
LALNVLRVSEAIGTDVDDLGLERGHHTLRIVRKSGNTVIVGLAPRTARTVYLAVGEPRPANLRGATTVPPGPCPTADTLPNASSLAGRAHHDTSNTGRSTTKATDTTSNDSGPLRISPNTYASVMRASSYEATDDRLSATDPSRRTAVADFTTPLCHEHSTSAPKQIRG